MATLRLLANRAALVASLALLASATPDLAGGPAVRLARPGTATIGGGSTQAEDGTTGGTAVRDDRPSAPRAPRAPRSDPLFRAALTDTDVGRGWAPFDVGGIPASSVVRIGGEVGVDNVPGTIERYAEIGYERSDPGEPGYVSNTILLMSDEAGARGAIEALRAAAVTTEWTQGFSRGRDDYRLAQLEFESVADELFAVRLGITTTEGPFGAVTNETADYVVFRIGRVLSFLFMSGVDSTEMAARSAERVRELADRGFD